VIRKARAEDLFQIVTMGRRFWESCPWREVGAYDPEGAATHIAEFIDSEDAGIFVIEQDGALFGMFGLAKADAWMADFSYAHEMFWWCEPRAAGEAMALLKRGEAWAAEHGLVMSMMRLDGQRDAALDRLYRMRGYRAMEHTYVRLA
jgi:hypothetical protein